MTDKTSCNDNPLPQRETCCLAIPALVRPHIMPMLQSHAVARAMRITVEELHWRTEACDGPEPFLQMHSFNLYEMASVKHVLEISEEDVLSRICGYQCTDCPLTHGHNYNLQRLGRKSAA